MKLYYTPEFWDLYDRTGKHVGKIRRGIEIPGGLYHTSVEVIPTDMHGHVLITRRAFGKRKGGGMYEFPAGSVLAGENPARAAIRELREETGLKAVKLVHLQTEKTPFDPNRSGLIRHTYIAQINDLQNAEVRLQHGETIDYQIVTQEELIRDYIARNIFDVSRLSFYRNDFFERLTKVIGEPPIQETEPKEPTVKPKFKLVKSSLRGSAAFERACISSKEDHYE